MLFDSRRRSCHLLILNFFVALGGLDLLLAAFKQVGCRVCRKGMRRTRELPADADADADAGAGTAPFLALACLLWFAQATQQLWDTIQSQQAEAEAAAAAAPPSSSSAGAPAALPPAPAGPDAAAAAASASGSGSKDREKEPRAVAEKAFTSFLAVLEQLSDAAFICASPQVSLEKQSAKWGSSWV